MNYYKEKSIKENVVVREFLPNVEYPWHRDPEDRVIDVVEVEGCWKFQKDDELPINIIPGLRVCIEKNTFHRIISGTGKLVLKITKTV